MRRFLFAVLLSSVVIRIVSPFQLQASQNSSTEIAGVVLDATRARLPYATVRLLDLAGAVVAETITDQQGQFHFSGSAATGRRVEAALIGFTTSSVPATPGAQVELILPLSAVRESVVVTATRTEIPTGQLAVSTTVLDRDEIAGRQARSVGDLLRTVGGASVMRNGAQGNVTSLFVRGGESAYNKVLLDGIPLNEPGGAYDFSNLLPENLERVEIVRGPQSALFGSDAMSSVVQLFTARGSEGRFPHVTLRAEGGKNSTWRSQAAVSGKTGWFDYALDWARFSTDNQTANNSFHNTTASANLGATLGSKTEMRVILRGDLGRTGTPGQTVFQRPDLDAFLRRGDGQAAFTLRHRTTADWDQRVTYAFNQTRYVSRDAVEDLPFTARFGQRSAPFESQDFLFDQINNTERHHVSYQSDLRHGSPVLPWGHHALSFAFDWDREQGATGSRLFGAPLTNARRDNLGTTFQHQVAWKRVFLTNSARVEDNGSFGVSVVPRSSLAYIARWGGDTLGATKLKFNFGLGIKEPTFVESFSPSPTFLGNPNLAPERVRSFDFGLEQRALRDRAKLELNWFDNRYRDQILFDTLGFNPFRGSFFNLGRAKAKGAEVIVDLAPARGWRVNASYTYLDSRITRDSNPFSEVFQVGHTLLRRPRHSGSLQVFWDWRRMNVTSSAVFVGKRADNDFSSLEPPLNSNGGYARWDLAWSWRSSHRITYFGVVENLLNREYMESLGYPALKLTYRAGIRLDF